MSPLKYMDNDIWIKSNSCSNIKNREFYNSSSEFSNSILVCKITDFVSNSCLKIRFRIFIRLWNAIKRYLLQ